MTNAKLIALIKKHLNQVEIEVGDLSDVYDTETMEGYANYLLSHCVENLSSK